MKTISISELRKDFESYLSLLESKKEDKIFVTRRGKKILILTPYQKNICGCGKDLPSIPDLEDFKKGFEDLPKEFGY